MVLFELFLFIFLTCVQNDFYLGGLCENAVHFRFITPLTVFSTARRNTYRSEICEQNRNSQPSFFDQTKRMTINLNARQTKALIMLSNGVTEILQCEQIHK